MLKLTVPLDTPSFVLRTSLDGATYLLRGEYQVRSGWYLGVSTSSGTVITSPRRLVSNWNVLRGVVSPEAPPGGIYLYDTTGLGAEASFEDFGRRHILLYLTADEVVGLP